jgi:hypothetical protein
MPWRQVAGARQHERVGLSAGTVSPFVFPAGPCEALTPDCDRHVANVNVGGGSGRRNVGGRLQSGRQLTKVRSWSFREVGFDAWPRPWLSWHSLSGARPSPRRVRAGTAPSTTRPPRLQSRTSPPATTVTKTRPPRPVTSTGKGTSTAPSRTIALTCTCSPSSIGRQWRRNSAERSSMRPTSFRIQPHRYRF